MRTVKLVLVVMFGVILSAGVLARRESSRRDANPAAPSVAVAVPLPTTTPAGVEVLCLVR